MLMGPVVLIRLAMGKVTEELRMASGFAAAASASVNATTRDEAENIADELRVRRILGSVEFDAKWFYTQISHREQKREYGRPGIEDRLRPLRSWSKVTRTSASAPH